MGAILVPAEGDETLSVKCFFVLVSYITLFGGITHVQLLGSLATGRTGQLKSELPGKGEQCYVISSDSDRCDEE